jgi:hypothetical protein
MGRLYCLSSRFIPPDNRRERDSREGNRSTAHARGEEAGIRERVDDESDAVASAGVESGEGEA